MPGLNVESSFGEVVKGVYRESRQQQYPWKEGVLLSDFHFTSGSAINTPAPSRELLFWQSVEARPTLAGYKAT